MTSPASAAGHEADSAVAPQGWAQQTPGRAHLNFALWTQWG